MKTALLIVDIQNDYFPGGKMTLEGTDQASKNAADLLATFRRLGHPVIHIQHIAAQPGATFFLPDTEGVKLHERVAPIAGETVITKNYPNSFRKTTLLQHLQEHQISHLVIAGMMTHMCIDTTTRAACDLELTVQLAHDACATKALTFDGVEVPADHVHRAYIAALNGSFAKAESTQEIIAGFDKK